MWAWGAAMSDDSANSFTYSTTKFFYGLTYRSKRWSRFAVHSAHISQRANNLCCFDISAHLGLVNIWVCHLYFSGS